MYYYIYIKLIIVYMCFYNIYIYNCIICVLYNLVDVKNKFFVKNYFCLTFSKIVKYFKGF